MFNWWKKGSFSKLDKYAAAIIDRCFENDRDFAINILRRPAVEFYDVNPLVLALKANGRAFLASKCVQKYLDNKWYVLIHVNLHFMKSIGFLGLEILIINDKILIFE